MRPLSICLIIFLLPALALSQIMWEKFEGNPVIDLGEDGSWCSEWVLGPCLLFDEGIFKTWYMGGASPTYRIGYASSASGEVWNLLYGTGGPVIGKGNSTEWDNKWVGYPCVCKIDETFHMWFTGRGSTYKIGHGTSTNGRSWLLDEANPVLEGTAGKWDEYGVHHPTVIHDGEVCHLWYAGYNDSYWQIGHATSPDGIIWVKDPENPVLTIGSDWESVHVLSPSVVFNGIDFQMWYSGYQKDWQIGYATSTDGTNWQKYPDNPVVPCGELGWDSESAWCASIAHDGNDYHMLYTGCDGTDYRIGYARSAHQFVQITPEQEHQILPSTGGEVNYSVFVGNYDTVNPVTGEFWVIITCPDGSTIGPLHQFINQELEAGQEHSLEYTEDVEETWQGGAYKLEANIGRYPYIVDSAWFSFFKER